MLVVEVADSSGELDRRVKLPLYAHAGIREAWIVDLATGSIEVYLEPGSRGFAKRSVDRRGETVTSPVAPGLAVAVEAVLPRTPSKRA